MTLASGTSKRVISANIRELHTGKTYKQTRKRYGAKKANDQATAIAMKKAGKARKRKKSKR